MNYLLKLLSNSGNDPGQCPNAQQKYVHLSVFPRVEQERANQEKNVCFDGPTYKLVFLTATNKRTKAFTRLLSVARMEREVNSPSSIRQLSKFMQISRGCRDRKYDELSANMGRLPAQLSMAWPAIGRRWRQPNRRQRRKTFAMREMMLMVQRLEPKAVLLIILVGVLTARNG
jgi:hypothetical protein